MSDLLRWSEEYELGIPAMDSDHKDLLNLCNEFLELATTGADGTALADRLDRLILRTRAHFLAEERMLDRHGYPALAVHKDEHARLLREADALGASLRNADADRPRIIAETSDFLRSWLLDHIRNNDRPYKPFLRILN